MKILHITNNLWSGGVTTFLEELLSYFSKENKITLLLLGKNEEKYNEEKLKNVKIIFLNQKKLYSLKNILKIRKLIKENDIIHSHLFPSQYITIISSLFLNKKIITTEHSTTNNRRKFFIFKLIDKIFYLKYKKIITISETTKINLINWIGMKSKIETIYNGIDLDKYRNGKNIRKELWNLKKEDKLICMIARFIPPKNHKTVIEAMKLLPENIKCIFVGIGQQISEVEEYVKIQNLENRIKFLGYREDIPNILNSCDFSILSSGYEGLPFVALESLASNSIFLGSNVNGIKEIFNDDMFLFENGNEKDLAFKIKEILENKNLRKEMIVKSKEIVKKYSKNEMIKQYRKIYTEVLNENI